MKTYLKKYGFVNTKETKYASEYKLDSTIIYVIPSEGYNIVLDPDTELSKFKMFDYKMYHSTALTNFSKRLNKGKKPIHYGYKFVFKDKAEVDEFLKIVCVIDVKLDK